MLEVNIVFVAWYSGASYAFPLLEKNPAFIATDTVIKRRRDLVSFQNFVARSIAKQEAAKRELPQSSTSPPEQPRLQG